MSWCSTADEPGVAAAMARYALAVDGRDWAEFASQFTEDCYCDYGEPFGVLRGTGQVEAWAEALHLGLDASMHRITNILVLEAEQDMAKISSYVDALFTRGERQFHGAGRFETELRRRGDRWAIARHAFFGMWAEGDFTVLDVAEAVRAVQATPAA
ncbi:MAG TPA: nuclear transport factor 2 family protein [Solirubrobacteraceae bacterium]